MSLRIQRTEPQTRPGNDRTIRFARSETVRSANAESDPAGDIEEGRMSDREKFVCLCRQRGIGAGMRMSVLHGG
jgi:hypothetical protein